MQIARDVLLGAQSAASSIPVCDHYCGIESRMRKSLALQAEMSEEFGVCPFDVTLDCEDGAPIGGENDHALMVADLARAHFSRAATIPTHCLPRVAVRVHPVDHPAFEQDVETIVGSAAEVLCHVMIPKVDSRADLDRAVQWIDLMAAKTERQALLPLHVLIESPAAVHQVFEIAAHARVQSLSFGLMDFVSAHGGAIPATAMGLDHGRGDVEMDQFSHPLVLRAKLEIASACHAHGKVPAHCVVTEFTDVAKLRAAARKASRALGFTRMWSIHPAQIRPILEAFAPDASEIDHATRILVAAQRADWAPISDRGVLQDRASYRYFWQVLERAQQTGTVLPDDARGFLLPAEQVQRVKHGSLTRRILARAA